jgi:hypothetical protein
VTGNRFATSRQGRFAEVDNQFYFNFGVDGVSLDATSVPEPATLTVGTWRPCPEASNQISTK